MKFGESPQNAKLVGSGGSMLTLKMTGRQGSYRRQDALGKVKRVKEIRRRGMDGLKI